jgi:23S rRNA-/tRNA-specific pseudouridylate synthase
LVLLTRSAEFNRALAQAWQTRTVEKEYRAVVGERGALADNGVIDLRLAPHPTRRDKRVVVARDGQHAITRYVVLGQTAAGIVVQLWPETGRMHQLRVHLAALGAPILGDRLYGDPTSAPRLMLHALRLTLPATTAGPPLHAAVTARIFLAPLPPGFNLT